VPTRLSIDALALVAAMVDTLSSAALAQLLVDENNAGRCTRSSGRDERLRSGPAEL
jgi:hypothetical protein